MTLLQERQPDFPEHPGDGFQIQEELPDGGFVMWTYSAQFNQWTYQVHTKQFDGFLYTDQVRTRPEARDAHPELLTQKDVNWFLDSKEPPQVEGPSLEGVATEEWVESQNYATRSWVNNKNYATKAELSGYATTTALADLQQQVDNLSGLVVQARYSNGNGITTRPGEFIVLRDDTQQTRFSAGDQIRFNETDATNKNPALVRIIIGDLIHVVDPRTGQSTVLQVTQAAGIVHNYTCLGGTMDTIPNNTALEFRISGTSSASTSVMSAEEAPRRRRARHADGKYRADDPSTPDVNEAWEES